MMASRIYIRIEISNHMKVFFETKFGNPVKFPKGSYINMLIGELLCKPAVGYTENYNANMLCIELPFYRGKNIRTHFYLSAEAAISIKSALRDMFYQSMNDEIIRARRKLGMTRKAAIHAFIANYDLDPGCFDSLKKKEYRDRHIRPLIKEIDRSIMEEQTGET